MNAAVSIVLLAAVLGVIVFLFVPARECPPQPVRSRRPFGVPHRPAAGRVLRPAGRASGTPTSSCTSAAGKRTAAFCCISPCTSPPSSRWIPCTTLRLDPGRQTVVTLIFIREAFGYKEPLFPQEMLDRIHAAKAGMPTAPNKLLRQNAFHFARNLVYLI